MRIPHRRIRNALEAGEPALGVCLQLPSPDIVEIAGWTGLHFVWIDAEHGTIDLGDLNQMIRAADASGIDVIVRVPDHSPSFIQRILDIGAAGIIAPHVRTAAEAAALVSATKYAPAGIRGACPTTRWVGHSVSDEWPGMYRQANADTMMFGLIEDLEGVENVEAIASVPGLDGLLFGPFDLSHEAGLDGDRTHPSIAEMGKRVTAAVREAGIEYIALPGWEFDDLASRREYARIFVVAGDRYGLVGLFRSARLELEEQLAQVSVGAAR
jgi:4-hydroxy-2-oxoheptanedioate aldolase